LALTDKVKDKGKGKVIAVHSLSTTPWRRSGKWRYSSTHSLTSALDGGEWSASHPDSFTLRERAPGTHWKRGCVGPRAGLDAVVKRKIPSSWRDSNPRSPSSLPVIILWSPPWCHPWNTCSVSPCFMCYELKGKAVLVLN
jgi:hypothetical protein